MKKVVWKTRFKGENCLFQSWKVELPVFQDISTIRRNDFSGEKNYGGKNNYHIDTREILINRSLSRNDNLVWLRHSSFILPLLLM